MDSRLTWFIAAFAVAGCAEGSTFGTGGEASDGPETGGEAADGGAPSNGGASASDGGSAPELCGNGNVDAGEDCDGADLGEESCATQEFAGGTLVCTAACVLDTSGCLATLCNNGVVDDGELCDGPNLGTASCAGSGFAGGTLTCTADTCELDTALCKAALAEDFEGGTIPAGFTSSGNANWLADTSSAYAGTYSARNGDITDYGTSSVAATVQFDIAGTISFYHLESTESGYDYLEFYIDGAMQGSWSGATSWSLATYPVAAGSHSLTWTYSKDVSISSGSDSVWVDEISAMNGYIP